MDSNLKLTKWPPEHQASHLCPSYHEIKSKEGKERRREERRGELKGGEGRRGKEKRKYLLGQSAPLETPTQKFHTQHFGLLLLGQNLGHIHKLSSGGLETTLSKPDT